MTFKTKKAAEAVVGTLSKPSKMPGHGYGLPARECGIGTRLRAVEGSTCSGCYAMKGRYVFANVQAAAYRRLEAITDPAWVDGMVFLIDRTGDDFFRWHDQGDLQSVDHLARIVEIARRLPHIRFWLPTRETLIVRDYLKSTRGEDRPTNLTIRISAHMVDHAPKTAPMGLPFSTVSTASRPDGAHVCPAPKQDNECGSCRACWDPNTAHVDYHKH